VNWVHLARDRDLWRAVVDTVMNIRVSRNAENFLARWATISFWTEESVGTVLCLHELRLLTRLHEPAVEYFHRYSYSAQRSSRFIEHNNSSWCFLTVKHPSHFVPWILKCRGDESQLMAKCLSLISIYVFRKLIRFANYFHPNLFLLSADFMSLEIEKEEIRKK
jgi:hypothetical protein